MMTNTNELLLSEFQYDLPDDRIARFPLPQRDASKLLIYKGGEITHNGFTDLPDQLPPNSFLVFNNTKVIPARLHFVKATGAVIELFLLNPFSAEPGGEPPPISLAMEMTGTSVWQGMIGNRKRWKAHETLETVFTTPEGELKLTANWFDYDQAVVRLNWQPANMTFAQVVQYIGEIPLPPYLKRDATATDRETYQTVYSKKEGAVAAPTAGLHFTPAIFDALSRNEIGLDYLTLHVGAGTFQPIKSEDVRQHHMHSEEVVYTAQNIQNLLGHLETIVAVGTTSMRALESLYWIGTQLVRGEPNPFQLDQQYAYQLPADQQPTVREALKAVLDYMHETGKESIIAHTGIYITPGYRIRLCKGLITNFHQPGSTLILLIATLIGNNWRQVYREALENDYRFLSYGDSSLLFP